MPEIVFAERAGVGADGHPRPTEDHVVVLDNAVLVLDGATSADPRNPPAAGTPNAWRGAWPPTCAPPRQPT